MASEHRDVDTREAPPGRRATDERRPRLACVTIVSHPSPRRLGERALLARPATGRPLALSRNALELAPPSGPARPLEDPYLSRDPIELHVEGDALRLVVPAKVGATIDGRSIDGEILLDAAALERGVLLGLRDRVLLLLHHAELGPPPAEHGLTGESAAIREVRRGITRVADLDVPVLIRGETGVGKERVAEAVHAASQRAGRCVAVNVATLTPSLVASELFGHEKGAFTGARDRAGGLFALADGGTLFLDEIGELPAEVQPVLLRALETGRVRPVGGGEEQAVDVRVIAATDADLEAAVAEGRFREALYHRLRGFEILVPPLRERPEDLPLLILALLDEELGRTGERARLALDDVDAPLWIEPSLLGRLVRHPWPGNVRQLRGALRQLAVGSRGAPTLRADAALERALAREAAPAADADAIHPERLRDTLARYRYSFGEAARALGLSRSAVYRMAAADPSLRTGSELDEDEIRRALEAHQGELDAAAAALRVSPRALRLRMRALGL